MADYADKRKPLPPASVPSGGTKRRPLAELHGMLKDVQAGIAALRRQPAVVSGAAERTLREVHTRTDRSSAHVTQTARHTEKTITALDRRVSAGAAPAVAVARQLGVQRGAQTMRARGQGAKSPAQSGLPATPEGHHAALSSSRVVPGGPSVPGVQNARKTRAQLQLRTPGIPPARSAGKGSGTRTPSAAVAPSPATTPPMPALQVPRVPAFVDKRGRVPPLLKPAAPAAVGSSPATTPATLHRRDLANVTGLTGKRAAANATRTAVAPRLPQAEQPSVPALSPLQPPSVPAFVDRRQSADLVRRGGRNRAETATMPGATPVRNTAPALNPQSRTTPLEPVAAGVADGTSPAPSFPPGQTSATPAKHRLPATRPPRQPVPGLAAAPTGAAKPDPGGLPPAVQAALRNQTAAAGNRRMELTGKLTIVRGGSIIGEAEVSGDMR